MVNPVSTDPIKWSNTFKQIVGKLPMNCLSVFGHFVEWVLKGLRSCQTSMMVFYYENIG